MNLNKYNYRTEITDDLMEAAVALMDDEIREEVHRDLAPCSNAEFLAEYERRHEEKYGETFEYI